MLKARSRTILDARDQSLVLIHFDELFLRESEREETSPRMDEGARKLHLLDWYVRWARGCVGSLFLLLPESMRRQWEDRAAAASGGRVLWYRSDGRFELPAPMKDVGFWLVNGRLFPIVNWDAADEAAARHSCDVLVFGPPGSVSSSQYPESLVVDESGRVVRVERHYFDSPAFTDVAYGPVSFCFITGDRRESSWTHLLSRGWNLDSIHGLSEIVAVEWCAAPSVLSSMAGADLRRGSSNRSERADDAGKTAAGGTAVLQRTTPALAKPRSPVRKASVAESGSAGAPSGQVDFPTAPQGGDRSPAPLMNLGGILSAPAILEEPHGGIYPYIKRAMDIGFSLAALTVSAPLFIAVAIIVKTTSRGPVFYSDRRQGKGGKEFHCYKFRTMVADAAARQAELRKLNEVDGPQFKITDDPRLTGIGQWLRKYNVDELPQFINVILGQMSLVGPRPSPDRENQLCPGWRRTRLSLRPGITGLWQVLRLRDAGPSDFQEWIYYDVEYARHQSFSLDCLILAYTPFTVWSTHRLANLARKLAKRGICIEADVMHRRSGGGA